VICIISLLIPTIFLVILHLLIWLYFGTKLNATQLAQTSREQNDTIRYNHGINNSYYRIV